MGRRTELPPAPMARASVCTAYRWPVKGGCFAYAVTLDGRFCEAYGIGWDAEEANENIAKAGKRLGFAIVDLRLRKPPETLDVPVRLEVASA